MDLIKTELWRNGPTPGGLYNFPGSTNTGTNPAKHTMQPIVTGTSVLGVKFDGGVVVAADTLGSYGSLARYRDLSRIMKVNDCTVMAAGGDYADFQYLKSMVEQRVIEEECLNDGFGYTPHSLWSWVTRVLYNRRSKFNPLWNTIVVGGIENGAPFLGYVDKIGVAYQSDSVASGFGAYMAQPLLRDALEKCPSMDERAACELLERCLRVLFYRDARSLNRYELAVITKEGVKMIGPKSAETNWNIAQFVKGYE